VTGEGLPRVGQRWIDTRFNWLVSDRKHVFTITSVWNTVTGVKCGVTWHEVDETDRVVRDFGPGVIFVSHLRDWCQLLEDARA
jgi:hypothetical protein